MGATVQFEADQTASPHRVLVVTFYQFAKLENLAGLKLRFHDYAESQGVLGTILLAGEGINGTLAGPEEGVRAVVSLLRGHPRLADLEVKESWSADLPFYRLRVRLKKEIVTMGLLGLDPSKEAGTYVNPEDWNELIDDPRVLVIDARNEYETGIGCFDGAIDPGTRSFRELPRWLREYETLAARPPVAMYCTGGIRCEKATAFLRAEGFDEVYHLRGGILKYLESVPEVESRWRGECFVFDQRVAVGPALEVGTYSLCYACQWPVKDDDKVSEQFEQGVCCPRCHGTWTKNQLRRFRERQDQVNIASTRGIKHLGQVFDDRQRQSQKTSESTSS